MATAPSKSMELEGNLRTFHLPDILRFLAMGKMTGTLTLRSGERTVELLIKEGRLAGTATTERFIKLGQLLVYNGAITRRDLNEALELQGNDEERMLGELLIERKKVSSEQVAQALLLQMKEELWELFSWSDGTFIFEHGPKLGMRRALLELDIEPLLAEGMQRMEQWQNLSRAMGDGEDVYQARGGINAMPEGRLTPNEWRVLSLVNGRCNARMLVMISGLGRFETFYALDHLQQLRLVEVAPQDPHQLLGVPRQLPMDPFAAPAAPAGFAGGAAEERQPNGGGVFSRFSRRKRPVAASEPEEPVRPASEPGEFAPKSYATALGWGCALLNRFADCLERETGRALDVEAVWRQESARYPKADLLEVANGAWHAAGLERFVELAGGAIDDSLAGPFEESMAALGRSLEELACQTRQGLGARAEGFINETLRPFVDGVSIGLPIDFLPRQWTEKAVQAGMTRG